MVLRQALLAVSRSELIKTTATTTPLTRAVVNRFVPGETTPDAVRAAGELAGAGLHCSIDHLGEDTTSREHADAKVDAYVGLLTALNAADLTDRAEVSLKLSALGQYLGEDGEKIAIDNAHKIIETATQFGTTVTIDMEDHTTTDSTLGILRELRKQYPKTGAVLQAYLYRTEDDCRELAYEGSRVRLCKGAYAEPESVAYKTKQEVDLAYVRCLKILMSGQGYPMIASHDPRLIDIAQAIAVRNGRERGTYEFQMLYGVRPDEQRRLASIGERVRVYIPYGQEWYGYLVRRMAEKPANMALFLKSMTTKS